MIAKTHTIQSRFEAKADKKMNDDINRFTSNFIKLFRGVDLGLSIKGSGDARKNLDVFDLQRHFAERYKEVKRDSYREKEVIEFEKKFEQMAEQFGEMIGFEEGEQ